MALEGHHGPLSGQSGCPDPELLAAYVDLRLSEADRQTIEKHLLACAECRDVLAETVAFLQAEPRADAESVSESSARAEAADGARDGRTVKPNVVPFRQRPTTAVIAALAAAAALLLAVQVSRPQWLTGDWTPVERPPILELVQAAAAEPTRFAEGRLTSGFRYAPVRTPTRGARDPRVSTEVTIAAAEIQKLASERDTPQMQAAFGVASLALGELDEAVAALKGAAAREPANAAFQNDLAVAYLARATRRGDSADSQQALDAVDRALQLDPNLTEAVFNRALALEQLQAGDAVIAVAWERYRRIDPSSEWSKEAGERR